MLFSVRSIATIEPAYKQHSTNKTSTALATNKTIATDLAALYPSSGIDFAIYRDDRRVGSYSVRFEASGDQLVVLIDSSIRVTILKVPVFTLRYTASELWSGDELLSAKATTRENTNSSTVSLENEGNLSNLSTLKGTIQVARLSYASNHWNADVLEAARLFNTLTGEASNIQIKSLGEETIATTSGFRVATRYQYTGDLETEVWYDSAGRWVAFAFNADDGSRIRYELID